MNIVTSKVYKDAIEANIIRLSKALSVELAIPIDEAVKATRAHIYSFMWQMLDEEELKDIITLYNETTESLDKNPSDKYHLKVYELLKLLEVSSGIHLERSRR